MNALTKAKQIAQILDSKKAMNIQAIRTAEQTILADYFVVASAGSTTHVKALADEVELVLKREHSVAPRGIEGRTGGWILLDYIDVIVHIFLQEQREYYHIERLWEEGEILPYEALMAAEPEEA